MALVRYTEDPPHVLSLEPALMLGRAARMADAPAAGQTVMTSQPCMQSTVGTDGSPSSGDCYVENMAFERCIAVHSVYKQT